MLGNVKNLESKYDLHLEGIVEYFNCTFKRIHDVQRTKFEEQIVKSDLLLVTIGGESIDQSIGRSKHTTSVLLLM